MTMKYYRTICLVLLAVLTLAAQASDKPYREFGNIKVFYSVFNSSFIQPEIASAYKIVRGKDRGLVNIAVLRDDKAGGTTALVKGTVSNILAQQQNLDFFEVREGDTVYYLAPFRIDNKDYMTFKIEVTPDPNQPPLSLTFQKTLYQDE
ncbi:MAG: DUF4426 domain-containing protein [Gammaproteobacteria bacterium]|nr:MAG: DUF4426 domain-containing protein [Gammaproteobacteria bacterium]